MDKFTGYQAVLIVFIFLGILAPVGLKVLSDYRATSAVTTTVTNETIQDITEDRVYNLNFSNTGSMKTGGQTNTCLTEQSLRVRNSTVFNGSTCNTATDSCNNTISSSNWTVDWENGQFTLTSADFAGDDINLTYNTLDAAGCNLLDSEAAITNQTDYLGLAGTIVIVGIVIGFLVAIFYRRQYW